MQSATTVAEARPTVADFYRVNRGGGLFSESVSQWLGAVFALVAQRLGLRPTALTIANLLLGLATSVTVVALAGRVAAGDVPAWVVGLLALVGWQVAYALDCADGQLARVTGTGSAAGARVDVLCDVAAQIALVAALSATAVAQHPDTPSWLVATFAGTWMVNLVTSVMQAGPNAASMVTSTSLPVRLVKLVRDYGAVIFVAALVLLFAPALTLWVLVAFTIVNGGFLLASIAFSARASL
ncbi:CDP-alcohol phosphatidyltransferase family protein [Micromonospora sp. PLK6-60]|uniref:CDP-alcohol phosphatidyltransferase family protein n=1 Tax=Micromonospora sp. PLK6-60 TaxID=2873383 RepID=UPI001CA6C9D6|nr:CDP-alcohol phosphatidyltransferase family protein [Micromonospora sp. PLK6-60]MBY8873696.1 CDP-alcohol phosphatidyltransferase family protein [Micromonospora sp. PLK6-60]